MLLDTVVGLGAALLRSVDDLKDLGVILVPVVLDTPRLSLKGRFFRVPDRLDGVDRLKNLPELISSDRIRVKIASALQHVAIVAVALLVSLDNDICSSQD